MDLFEAIDKRYSYRGKFTDAPVPRADLERIVETGIQAPSAYNAQVTSFVIVDDPELLKQIAGILERPVCNTAQAMIACATQGTPAPGEFSWAREDCSAAVENMLLAITALGYASVWLGKAFYEDDRAYQIAHLLNVPTEWVVRVVLPIGIAAEAGTQKKKQPFEKRAWFNRKE